MKLKYNNVEKGKARKRPVSTILRHDHEGKNLSGIQKQETANKHSNHKKLLI